jgi:hypothetical protein
MASMILSGFHFKVARNCGVEDSELVAWEININPDEIHKTKMYNTNSLSYVQIYLYK